MKGCAAVSAVLALLVIAEARHADAWLAFSTALAALFTLAAPFLDGEAFEITAPPARPDRHAPPAVPATHDGAFGPGAAATRKG
jgi:hypothetical protein